MNYSSASKRMIYRNLILEKLQLNFDDDNVTKKISGETRDERFFRRRGRSDIENQSNQIKLVGQRLCYLSKVKFKFNRD